MFQDYPHKNTLITIKGKLFIKKELQNHIILYKEYHVLNFLEKYHITPKVKGYNQNFYYEEFINGKKLSKNKLNKKNIIKLAKAIKIIHSVAVSPQIRKLIKDKYIKNIYRPSKIYFALIKNNRKFISKAIMQKIEFIMYKMDDYFSQTKYKIGLIHGDLSLNNILIKKGDVYIVDWSDCRLDVLSSDISQLFYLCKFNKNQKKIFLDNYNNRYIDERILYSHEILLLLYDIIDCNLKGKSNYKTKYKKLQTIINKYAY